MVNGVIAVPIMVVMMLMASRTDIMGAFTLNTGLRVLGWGCCAAMAVVVIIMCWGMLT